MGLRRALHTFSMLSCLLAAGVSTESVEAKPRRESGDLPGLAEHTRGMTEHAGVLRFWTDAGRGKIWLEIPPPRGNESVAAELLYVEGLRSGLGSNPVGLDRGQLGATRWVVLRRIGPRVLLEQRNPAYRATSSDPAERGAARESFATSVLWAEEIAALDDDGRAAVDFSSFLVRDAHGVTARLEQSGQGAFTLDPGRSTIDPAGCLAFPDNVEFEAILTYAGEQPGPHVRQTTPAPEAITLVQHHSFVRLPDAGYRTRRFDPRAGSFGVSFLDYAAPLPARLRTQWISRHRLEKVDPHAERSRVRKPVVFYVDRGAPEPVRSALVEGAAWWAAAFEAAGFVDAFRVELLPEGADPLDVRYNVIQWVHRSTRGWSYGGGVIDPRTGEILKGHVSLGSLRVRQDRLLFEGLAGTERTGTGAADDPIELALARIRQLSAHEVGHALGLTHNFAASTYAGRASVMDYPAPWIDFGDDGALDFSQAYGVGVGAWDRHAVRYAYSEFAPGTDEDAALARIVREGLDAGLLFLTDEDARPAGASDPRANLWDNGDDAVAALRLTMRVRRHALDRFGEHNVAVGTPLALLEEVLAPLYFHHRYQLDAAAKVVGGMEYHYAVRGDGQIPTRVVSAGRQRDALDAILESVDPTELDLPDEVLRLLAPRPHGEPPSRELFASTTAPAFDVQSAAATAAGIAFDGLLQRERLGRLAEQHRRDRELPGVEEVLDRLLDAVLADGAAEPSRAAELRRVVQSTLVNKLIALAADAALPPTVAARVTEALERVRDRDPARARDTTDARYRIFLASEIVRFLERPSGAQRSTWMPAAAPPGSPIGADAGCAGPDGSGSHWPGQARGGPSRQ